MDTSSREPQPLTVTAIVPEEFNLWGLDYTAMTIMTSTHNYIDTIMEYYGILGILMNILINYTKLNFGRWLLSGIHWKSDQEIHWKLHSAPAFDPRYLGT